MEFKVEERNCIVCGSNETEVLNVRDPWSRSIGILNDEEPIHDKDVICTKCGLAYKSPMMTKETMSEFYGGGTYKELYKGFLDKQISKKWIVENLITTVYLLDFIKEIGLEVQGKKLLDVGSGSGTLMKGFSSLGAEVCGVEPCERHVEISDKVFGVKTFKMDFEDFQSDNKFDIITFSNSLEHFHNPCEALMKAKSMLNPGGKIIVEVPSLDYPYPTTLVSAFLSAAHNFTWQKGNFIQMVGKIGLGVTDVGEGHKKCMIFVMDESSDVCISAPPQRYTIEELKDRLKQTQNIAVYAQQLSEELSKGSSVNSIIEKIKAQYQWVTNALNYFLANKCLEIGNIEDGLALSQQPYQKAQSADFNYCQGSSLFTTAIGYRLLGDFMTAKRYLDEAMNSYPGIERHNFIKELYIDGIVSESGFSDYGWFACKTLSKSLN